MTVFCVECNRSLDLSELVGHVHDKMYAYEIGISTYDDLKAKRQVTSSSYVIVAATNEVEARLIALQIAGARGGVVTLARRMSSEAAPLALRSRPHDR